MSSMYELRAKSLEGEPVDLASFSGNVTLVVNVASACGLTPHYAGLQKLHDELSDKGFAVLGFPCNQFGAQEPGSAAEIREFCTSRFRVSFPLFEKVEVKGGPGQHPVYQFLTAEHAEPDWNFTKYLISREGRVLKRYEPTTSPDDAGLLGDIADAL